MPPRYSRVVVCRSPAKEERVRSGEREAARHLRHTCSRRNSHAEDEDLELAKVYIARVAQSVRTTNNMAAVYKSMSKQKSNGRGENEEGDSKPKNRQRVLMLSSRGMYWRI